MIGLKPIYSVFLKEEDDRHMYCVEGQETYYVGATTILNAYPKQLFLAPWAAKTSAEYLRIYLQGKPYDKPIDDLIKEAKGEHKRLKKEAGELGSAFHELANQMVKHHLKQADPVDIKAVPEALAIPWNSFLLWLDENKPKFLLPDTAVIHEEEGFGGSFDCLIEEDGIPIVVDFKTASALGQDFCYQIASYIEAFKEVYGFDGPVKGRAVRFAKKGKPKYEQRDIKDVELSYQGFFACLALYKNMALQHWEDKN